MVFGLLNAPTALLALDRAAETFATLLCVRADPATVFSTLPLALLASIRAAVEVLALFVAMVSSPPGPPRLVATIERSAPRGRLSIAGRLGGGQYGRDLPRSSAAEVRAADRGTMSRDG